ncbi:hypothetical protein H8356DRAFT_1077925 [Neocallimastix lanati (nom. inval.)]|uniref:Uncharacterized protein n=1 Tax=Neocallimastix californiae TaxID=1754190 RepID=A0A1Y2A8S3_9FUNG|nr:hypothetical protein H8356DRAFT_1077925 [Neocallimastix sp. JGI-2020a]ORY18435.1 hypothetical protein LY90DRAFT_517408 [Neocallimastix californiae]|eukprot:ORY18435.1 hypothetical protein LY90DRAFT_517408 [Neocallimastix californiae]
MGVAFCNKALHELWRPLFIPFCYVAYIKLLIIVLILSHMISTSLTKITYLFALFSTIIISSFLMLLMFSGMLERFSRDRVIVDARLNCVEDWVIIVTGIH